MTVLINLLAAPSCGKTTLAARLLTRLKDLGLNVEFTPEYVKSWAWDKRTISPYDQFYFFGKEAHNQSHLFNKVDFIISDSPVLLTAFYHLHYNNDNALREICKDFYDMAERLDNVKVLNYYLPRKKKYDPKGRYQTEEQANEIAKELLEFLNTERYPYKVLDCADKDRADMVFEDLELLTDNFEGMLEWKI